MTRPARNRLLVVLFVVAVFVVAPRLPSLVTWVAAVLGATLIALSLWVTRPIHRARSLLASGQHEPAALELVGFEQSLTSSGWKRALASLAVGLHTTDPLAAGRNTLGAVRLEQGRYDDARTHFEAALARDPGYGVPWGNLAVLAAIAGDAARAAEARQQAASRGFNPRILGRVIADKLAASEARAGVAKTP